MAVGDHLCSKDSSSQGKIKAGVFGHAGRIMDLRIESCVKREIILLEITMKLIGWWSCELKDNMCVFWMMILLEIIE